LKNNAQNSKRQNFRAKKKLRERECKRPLGAHTDSSRSHSINTAKTHL
jgi:hypothetical protein